MTETKAQDTIIQYETDGITTTFTYNFLILQANTETSDIVVYFTPANQVANPIADLVSYTTYTVTGVGNPLGGTVVFDVAPAASGLLTISRQMAFTLNTNFANVQTFNGANLDSALQRLTLFCQQLNTDFEFRSVQYSINDYLPTPFSNKLPVLTTADNQVWISQGGSIVAAELTEDNMSTFRSQIASEVMGGDGASLVGYYDVNTNTPQTVAEFLNSLVLSTLFRPGMMIDYAGYTAPAGFLLCDGSAVSRVTYSSLMDAISFVATGDTTNGSNVIENIDTTNMFDGMTFSGPGITGTASIISIDVMGQSITISENATATATADLVFFPWGAGDGVNTFNVPDTRRRSSVGVGGTDSSATGGVGILIGQTGGEQAHIQLEAELAAHTHANTLNVTQGGVDIPFSTGVGNSGHHLTNLGTTVGAPFRVSVDSTAVDITNVNTGSSDAFNIYQPSYIVTKIIKT